uniref:Putative secreted protein n=1 Tax=Anopheles triannulatus TaxID=58253 RepID=A0A2M4B426_9DIPT
MLLAMLAVQAIVAAGWLVWESWLVCFRSSSNSSTKLACHSHNSTYNNNNLQTSTTTITSTTSTSHSSRHSTCNTCRRSTINTIMYSNSSSYCSVRTMAPPPSAPWRAHLPPANRNRLQMVRYRWWMAVRRLLP